MAKKKRKAYPIMSLYLDKHCFWVRLFGFGIQIKNTEMLFSERGGHTKTHRLPFGWRFRFLTRKAQCNA